MAGRVVDLVPDGVQPPALLDAGCGTGAVIRAARQRWPDAHITGIDIAAGMAQQAKQNFAGDAGCEIKHADILQYQPSAPFDLVLSSSALHWMRPFDAGFRRVASMVKTGGFLAAGVMLDGTLGELHAARAAVTPAKPVAARLPTLEELAHAARMIDGARLRNVEQSTSELDYPDARSLLRSLNAMGVTGGDLSVGGQPLTRRELNELMAWYDRHGSSPHGVRVTFVVGYIVLEF